MIWKKQRHFNYSIETFLSVQCFVHTCIYWKYVSYFAWFFSFYKTILHQSMEKNISVWNYLLNFNTSNRTNKNHLSAIFVFALNTDFYRSFELFTSLRSSLSRKKINLTWNKFQNANHQFFSFLILHGNKFKISNEFGSVLEMQRDKNDYEITLLKAHTKIKIAAKQHNAQW